MISKIIRFFSSLKITSILTTVIATLLMIVGYKNKKIVKLEDDKAVLTKKDNINQKQEKASIKAKENENKSTKDINTDDWRNSI